VNCRTEPQLPDQAPVNLPPTTLFHSMPSPAWDMKDMRIDLSALGVLSLAVASSLGVLWWMDPAGLRPSSEEATAAQTAAHVVRGADGHYWADARIEDRSIRLMVDTGASQVVLTRSDADRLGLDLPDAAFSSTITTASGQVRAASVNRAAVSVAGARVEKVEALVVEQGLPHSLLGMSYLGRLSGFSATPTQLTLQG
jgi:aspartyl protease family protein